MTRVVPRREAENESTIWADGQTLHPNLKRVGSGSRLAVAADGSRTHVADLVETVDVGLIGRSHDHTDDFGSITEDVTYFDQDNWGSIA